MNKFISISPGSRAAMLAAAILVGGGLARLQAGIAPSVIGGVAAGAAVGIAPMVARWATGGRIAVPAVTAAALLTCIGVITAQEVSGAGMRFALGGGLGFLAFIVVAGSIWATGLRHSIETIGPRRVWLILGAALTLMVATRIPGLSAGVLVDGGATVYPNVRLAGLVFQPGEFVRPLVAAAMAITVAQDSGALRRGARSGVRALVRVATIVGVGGIMFVVNSDLGPLLFLAITTVLLLLVARTHMVVKAAAVGALAALFTVGYAVSATFRGRIDDMLHPVYADGRTTNIGFGLKSLASGGLFGAGVQDDRSPGTLFAEHTDFVLTAIGHSRGVVFLGIVVALYAVIVRAMWSATDCCRGEVARHVAVCLTLLVMTQCLWTVAATLGYLPLTGMVVPFLSDGMSGMVGMWATLGVVFALGGGSPVPLAPDTPASRFPAPRLESSVAFVGVTALVLATGVLPRVEPGSNIPKDWAQRRGMVVAVDGTVLARTNTAGDGRDYPLGELFGDTVGFTAPGSGRGMEDDLRPSMSCVKTRWQELLGRNCEAPSLVATFNPARQRQARDLLQGKAGDALLVDLHTGGIIAAYSTSALDPGRAVADAAIEGHPYAVAREHDPRTMNGPAFQTYATAPGSVFKLVTAAAALEHGVPTETAMTTGYQAPGGTQLIPNANGTLGGGSLEEALAASANTAFAAIAVRTGEAALRSMAEKASQLKATPGGLAADPITLGAGPLGPDALARSGFGQEGVRATPLAVAALGAYVSGGSEIATMRVLAGRCIGGSFEPQATTTRTNPLSQNITTQLRAAMARAVAEGRVDGVAEVPGGVGAKTGTATRPDGAYDATIVAFAPVNTPRYLAVVRVEGAPGHDRSGGEDAGPIAGALLKEAVTTDSGPSQSVCAATVTPR